MRKYQCKQSTEAKKILNFEGIEVRVMSRFVIVKHQVYDICRWTDEKDLECGIVERVGKSPKQIWSQWFILELVFNTPRIFGAFNLAHQDSGWETPSSKAPVIWMITPSNSAVFIQQLIKKVIRLVNLRLKTSSSVEEWRLRRDERNQLFSC